MLYLFTACQKIELDNNRTSSTIDNRGEESGETYSNAKRPVVFSDGTIEMQTEWHVIAIADTINKDSVHALLISMYEWQNIPTGLSDKPTAAEDSARHYKEGSLTGWKIPSKEQAQALFNKFSSCPPDINTRLIKTNKTIGKINGYPIRPWYDNYEDLRYLCQDASHSFTLCNTSGFRMSKTGTGTGSGKKYFLRLVKDTIITSNNNGTSEDISISLEP